MAHPLWLLTLIPWAALVLYFLTGRRVSVTVPFLDLWPNTKTPPRSNRSWRIPPPAITSLLAAIFLAIISAAGPRIGSAFSKTSRPIVFIADRGFTMSARSQNQRRFQRLAADSAPSLVKLFGSGPATLLAIPGPGQTMIDRADLVASVAAFAPSADDSKAAVADATRRALLDPQAIVLVLSDQKIGVNDDRLIQIIPREKIANIGIADVAVRTAPTTQAMVRVLNDSSNTTATLRLTAADPVQITLPPRGEEKNCFIDLNSAPPQITAAITPGGDIDFDDTDSLTRSTSWPKLSAQCILPAELQRMLEVYTRDRPPGPESKQLELVQLAADLPPNQLAAAIVTDAVPTVPISNPPQSEPHPLTNGIDWPAATRAATAATLPPGPGWHRLLWAGDQTLLAIRTQPQRQIWFALRSPTFATMPDFVLFWSRAFDWLGAGADQYIAQNKITPVKLDPAPPTDWQKKLQKLLSQNSNDHASLSSWTLLTSLACLLIAALTLPRHSPSA